MNTTKKVLSVLFVFSSLFCFSQKFYGELGLGLGAATGGQNSASNMSVLKGILFLGTYIHFNEKTALGLEAATGFPIIFPLIGSNGNVFIEDTELLDPIPRASNLLLLKGMYFFDYKGVEPFIALGIGGNTYVNRLFFKSNGEPQRIKNTQLAVQPELGIRIEDFYVSIRMPISGKTPFFSGTDAEGSPILLESFRVNPILVTANYRFKF